VAAAGLTPLSLKLWVTKMPSLDASADRIRTLEARVAELEALINTPETADFMKGLPLEAAHQIERWGADHDAGKNAWDWFWTCGYLAQKAAAAMAGGDLEKARHHTITTAALMLNWHRQLVARLPDADLVPCLACAKPIPDDAPTYPDVEGTLCAECAPTFADLLDDDAAFVDQDSGDPLSSNARRAIYDAHLAIGGSASDSMARP